MVMRTATIWANEYDKTQTEVLVEINTSGPRRICLCTHKQDADDIVTALKFAHEKGII